MNPIVHVVYRVSDKGHNAQKLKLPNAEKRSCLLNAIEQFGRENIYVIADNCSQDFTDFIKSEGLAFEETHLGNSPSFKYAVTKVINTYCDNDVVYLLEDDYLHLPGSKELISEGLEIADYVSLYDHPDKYMTGNLRLRGASPFNRFGFHRWRIFITAHSHWQEAATTTMTFAARVKTLKEDYRILMHNPDAGVPNDFGMFLTITKQRSLFDIIRLLPTMPKYAMTILLNNFALFRKKRLLVSCIPGRATHCETKWLSPLTDWTKI